jgi:tetratricopeptide (TPR) repeat protein
MLTIKKRVGNKAAILLTSLGLLAGCMPSGPRALLQGERLIEQGNYAAAAERLRTATSLLATNAQAWNYLAIACHHLGEQDEAVRAYQRALSLNHDLSEAHYNLGCLWLEQNKLEAARTEFTAYTLRRGNAPEGFLQLATVQARARDFTAAERSFTDVLRLSPQNPEALNGLGLLRLQQRRPAEAEQFFAAALKQQPGYRPALLNSAIVTHQYLHDLPGARQKYRAYLALKPPPPDAESVATTVRQIDQELTVPPRPAPVVTNPAPPKPAPAPVTRVLAAPKVEPPVAAPKPLPVTNGPKIVPALAPAPAPAPVAAPPVQVVQLAPEPVVKPAQDVAPRPAPIVRPPAPVAATSSVPVATNAPKPVKRGFLDRVNPVNIFRSEPKPPLRPTPLPPLMDTPAPAPPLPAATTSSPAAAAPYSHYNYRSPAKPAAGNREEAQRLFDQGLQAQNAHRVNDAIPLYRQAVQQDPSFFEAQFYLAFAATEAGQLPVALTSYEYALAINPNEANARYNFALVLKQANCLPDAVNELERLLALHPDTARAHLALANIYAQQLRQPARARQHYLKVLELDPRSPEATTIGYWLRDHPP